MTKQSQAHVDSRHGMISPSEKKKYCSLQSIANEEEKLKA